MSGNARQAGALLCVSAPFGTDDLLLDSLEGSEALSELFSFKLRLRSRSAAFGAAEVIGKHITVTVGASGAAARYVSGMVAGFAHTGSEQGYAVYEAELVPSLWLLTLSRDRKIYPNLSVDAVIGDMLGRYGIAYDARLGATYPKRDYWVQYDESAFDFISRLMEAAGIAYHFRFSAAGHRLVLTDTASQFAECEGGATLRFWPDTGLTRPADTVTRFAHEHRLVPHEASVDDYDFRTPETSLAGTHAGVPGKGTLYEFGGGAATGEAARALARLRVQASQAGARLLHGDSYCHALSAGTRFALTGHFVEALNASFVLRRVHHSATDRGYENAFEAFPADVPFCPALRTPRPRASGCETAVVLGPPGEEIWTDSHGRVKLHFPWDRDAPDHERAPWIRVSQAAAGKGFGALFLPRVGHEVVVSYLNGDPDRPLVTGCVYNGSNVTPADLPANQTQSILRTRSSKDGSAGNELRFEDKKDAEQLYLHAQKDMLVEIEHALTTTVKKGAELHVLEEGDRGIEVRKGKETHTVAGTRSLAVKEDETHANEAGFRHTVKGDYALTVDGTLTITVKGALKLVTDDALALEAGTTLAAKAGTGLSAKAGTTLGLDAGTDLSAKAGKALLHSAGLKIDASAPIISSKADAAHTVEAGGNLTLKGALAKVN